MFVTTTSLSEQAVGSQSCELTQWAEPISGPVVRRAKLRRTCERGMATAEYAVGILAAVALALVLLKVFTDNSFFTVILKFVTNLIGKAGGML